MNERKLALKREVLTELSDTALRGIAAGRGGTDTCYSCMTFISCYLDDCIATLKNCADPDLTTLTETS